MENSPNGIGESNMETKGVVSPTGIKSTDISLEDARKHHVNYLIHGPHVEKYDATQQAYEVVHSFHIEPADLEILMANQTNGVRIYFGRKDPDIAELSLILVPVGDDEENILDYFQPDRRPIINTLEPCPDSCPAFSTRDLNYVGVASGNNIWCLPNKKVNGKYWYENAQTSVNAPDLNTVGWEETR